MGNVIYITIIDYSSNMKETIYNFLGIENDIKQIEINPEFPEYDIVDKNEYHPYTFSKQNK